MLARRVLTLVDRALGTAPQVLAQPAIDLVLGFLTLGHIQSWFRRMGGRQPRQPVHARNADPPGEEPGRAAASYGSPPARQARKIGRASRRERGCKYG